MHARVSICIKCRKEFKWLLEDVERQVCAECRAKDVRHAPLLELVEESEIEAMVDAGGISLDGVCRPVAIYQEQDSIELTVYDARRLLRFLNEAIPYLEGRRWQKN